MIRLLELYPEHLNLNGDRGNLLVLQRRIEWAGIAVERVVHRIGDDLGDLRPDLILLGHGSKAAWRQIYADLRNNAQILNDWFDSGVLGLAVSSGHAALTGLVRGFENAPERVERVSKFEITTFGELEILGYLNSDLNLPVIERRGSVIATQLHGPLLAKNPRLADELISEIVNRKGLVASNPKTSKFEEVDSLVAEVWKLEKEML